MVHCVQIRIRDTSERIESQPSLPARRCVHAKAEGIVVGHCLSATYVENTDSEVSSLRCLVCLLSLPYSSLFHHNR